MNYKRNKKIILLSVFLISHTVFLLIAGLIASTKSKGNLLLTISNYVVDCCVIFFNKIGTLIFVEKIVLAYIGLAFLSFGFAEAIWRLLTKLKKVKHLRSQLKIIKNIKIDDLQNVNIFEADNLSAAFTTGFLKPEIFISSGMWKMLDEEERNSVIAHEYHHAVERDPLKIIILNFLSDMFFFVPLIKYLNKKFEESMEKSADDEVKRSGVNELSLASALLKVSSTGGLILPVASFANLDSKSLLESRVVRLIEPDRDRRLKIPRRIISATAILYFVLLISAFTLPENLFSKSAGECVHSGMHSSCSQMSPEECRKHCLGNKGDQKE